MGCAMASRASSLRRRAVERRFRERIEDALRRRAQTPGESLRELARHNESVRRLSRAKR